MSSVNKHAAAALNNEKFTDAQRTHAETNTKTRTKASPNRKGIMKSTLIVFNSSRPRTRFGPSDAHDYFKTYTLFQCTNIGCKRHARGWKSVHGWQEEPERCEFCDKKAKVVKVEEEPDCELDTYVCGCGSIWDCLHDPVNDEIMCYKCGTFVTRSGTQSRHALHYWFKCTNCKEEWETATTGPVFSQRCKNCHSAGAKVGRYTETKEERDHRLTSERNPFMIRIGCGTHDIEGCDMCQALQMGRVARTCTRSEHIRVVETENGELKLTDMTKRPT